MDNNLNKTSNVFNLTELDGYYELKTDQINALVQIEKFLKNMEEQVFILQGTTNSGKSYLIPFIKKIAYQLNTPECKVFAMSNRVANNLNKADNTGDVNSIYSYIYGGSKSFVDNCIEISENEEESEDFLVEKIPLKKSNDLEKSLFIVDDSQLISDSFHNSIDLIFGSGQLLKDFLNFADIEKAKRKIIFIGDCYQLQLGRSDETALNSDYLNKEYKLKVRTYELIDKPYYSDINKQALICVEAIKNKYFSSLSFLSGTQFHILKKENIYEAVKRLIDLKSGHILCFSNEDSQKVNFWIKKSILNNSDDIAVNDIVVFNNNIFIEEENNPFGETGKIFNGQFASVISVSKELYLNDTKKIKEEIVTIAFREITLKIIETGQIVNILSFENYRLSPKAQLSKNELIYYKNILNNELSILKKQMPFEDSNEYKELNLDLIFIKLKEENNEFILQLVSGKSRKKNLSEDEEYLKKKVKEAKQNYRIRIENILKSDSSTKYYKLKNAAHLRFGWAMTVHKAMLYKWDEVIFNINQGENTGITNQNYFKWLYTGISRAKSNISILNYKPITPFDNTIITDSNLITKQKNLIFISENNEKEKSLDELKQYISEKLIDSNIRIESIESLNWQERYNLLNKDNIRAVLSIYYNRKGEFQIPKLFNGDSILGDNIVKILKNKSFNFDFSVIKDNWRKTQYKNLSQILEEQKIYFEHIVQYNYKDKIRLFDKENEITIELDYTNLGTFSRLCVKYYSNIEIWEKLKKCIIKIKEDA